MRDDPTVYTAFQWLRQVLVDPDALASQPGVPRRRFSEGGIGLVWTDIPPNDPDAPARTAATRRYVLPANHDESTPLPSQAAGPSWVEQNAFVIDDGVADVTLVLGAEIRHLARGEGGNDLLSRAAQAVAAWRREQVRLERKAARMDSLLAFTESLHRSHNAADVAAGLRAHAHQVVGGRAGLAAFREPLVTTDSDAPGSDLVFSAAHLGIEDVRVPATMRRAGSGVLSPGDAVDGAPFAPFAPLFNQHGAVSLMHADVGRFGMIVITERRHDRAFLGEDWEMLHAVARHAEAALERITAQTALGNRTF